MRHVIFSSVTCRAVPYFSTSSHKLHDFRKNVSEREVHVLTFYENLSEKCVIMGSIWRDIIMDVLRLRVKCLLFLSDFN